MLLLVAVVYLLLTSESLSQGKHTYEWYHIWTRTRSVFLIVECGGCCRESIALIGNADVAVRIFANPLLERYQTNEVARDRIEISPENTSSAWCSTMLSGTSILDPYLEFHFNSSYLIETVCISGDQTFPHRYATEFLVQNDTKQGSIFIGSLGIISDTVSPLITCNTNDTINISLKNLIRCTILLWLVEVMWWTLAWKILY